MVATLRSARLRQAFFLRASWTDPLTLKLIIRIGDSSRSLSTVLIHILSKVCPRFYPHRLAKRLHVWQPRLHANLVRDTFRLQREQQGGQYRAFRSDAPEFEQDLSQTTTIQEVFSCAYPTTPRGSTCTPGSARGRSSMPTSATVSSPTRSPTASTTPGTTTTCSSSTGSSSTTSPYGTWPPSGRSRSRAPTPSSSPTCSPRAI